MDNAGRLVPPDWETEHDNICLLNISRRAINRRSCLFVLHFDSTSASLIVPVQICGTVLLRRLNFIQLPAHSICQCPCQACRFPACRKVCNQNIAYKIGGRFCLMPILTGVLFIFCITGLPVRPVKYQGHHSHSFYCWQGWLMLPLLCNGRLITGICFCNTNRGTIQSSFASPAYVS